MLTVERKSEIENIADSVLKKYNINDCPAHKLKLILDSENILLFKNSIEDENFDGLLILNNDNQYCIYINTIIDYIPRQNFTIAHELGHYFLKHELIDGSLICDRTCISEFDESNSTIEQEANYFATCLLMPRSLFLQSYNTIIKKLDRDKYGIMYVDNQSCNYNDWKKMTFLFYKDFEISILALRFRLEEFNLIEFNLHNKWHQIVEDYIDISYNKTHFSK